METMPAQFQTSSRFRTFFIAGIIGCWCFAIWLALLSVPVLSTRCSKLKDGMNQNEVRQALGNPTWVGTSGCIGAGSQPVTRWEYKGWHSSYYVDFDYIQAELRWCSEPNVTPSNGSRHRGGPGHVHEHGADG